MGTSSSLLRSRESLEELTDGVYLDGNLDIPNEVKPRHALLRSVGSFGRRMKGASFRSNASVDLMENPEAERIRKEYEMFRYSKQSEIQDMQKKMEKLENENKRLRGELQALQKTVSKLRNERDAALNREYQALERAATFENDRDKVQRQFKIFRETKESELQDLLQAKRDLENRILKFAADDGTHVISDNMSDNLSYSGTVDGGLLGNPGDWGTALGSEPSLGSTVQMHLAVKGPELATSLIDLDGPFTNINKDDWTAAVSSLSQITPLLAQTLPSCVFKIFISAPPDMCEEVQILYKNHLPALQYKCACDGRVLVTVHFTEEPWHEENPQTLWKLQNARKKQIQGSSLFLGLLGGQVDRYTVEDFEMSHLVNPGSRPALFCFRDKTAPGGKPGSSVEEAVMLKKRVRDSVPCKIIEDYTEPKVGAKNLFDEIAKIVQMELGVGETEEGDSGDEKEEEASCFTWLDPDGNYEQMELFNSLTSICADIGFEKYYKQLNELVSAPGPMPPLLLMGTIGAGKSSLLAQWIKQLQQRSPPCLVLYHFVGYQSSSSTDAVHMIRSFTAQLMQHVMTPPHLPSDPSLLLDEFLRWLERVSSKQPGGLVLVIDSMDKFQHAESHTKFLLDPLPVDTRVVVSVTEQTCPQAWRSWPTVVLEPLNPGDIKQVIQARWTTPKFSLTGSQEARFLAHCHIPACCSPLYVNTFLNQLMSCQNEEMMSEVLEECLKTPSVSELYLRILQTLEDECPGHHHKSLFGKVMLALRACRNGLSEPELMAIVPDLTWSVWSLLWDMLSEGGVLCCKSGLITFTNQEAQDAVDRKFLSSNKDLKQTRQKLVDYFSTFIRPVQTWWRAVDEAPWLLQVLGDVQHLHAVVVNLSVFQNLYTRGRCAELLAYWQFVGVEKSAMATEYMNALKMLEDGMSDVTSSKLASLYELLGKFLKDLSLLTLAVPPLQRALELRETSLDPDHPSVASALHHLAGLYAHWGKFNTAEALYKQAIDIYQNAFGSNHHQVARELEALALLYQRQNKFDVAEPLHKRAVTIRKRSPENSRLRSAGLEFLRKRAVHLEELSLGPDSPALARSLNELGVLFYLQGYLGTAEKLLQHSLSMRESVLDASHPDCAQSLHNLASLYVEKKEYAKAEPLYERALELRQEAFPADHPAVASTIRHLAAVYKKQNNFDKAEPLYRQALAMREKVFGDSHPSVATALVNLAVLQSNQGRHSDALPLYEKALQIYEDNFGPNNPRVAETLRNLAVLHYDLKNYETAANLYKRATEIKDPDHPFQPSREVLSRRSSSVVSENFLHNGLNAQLARLLPEHR
ncbi:KLC4 [Branchiostoma lanceolatum]|uniref:Nephrocystin-3 n=2 Tax=Branchiostoma lanceolatum TaxID=7740 RepID=A0A8K0AFT9_BRALA|nr:KLC4 [Branchiostoma lanceolatum]